MRLNCALVSSFLFVSAVLAGTPREKQQPPFLPRVEKPINGTPNILMPTNFRQLAGGGILEWYSGSVSASTGTFTVPTPSGEVGSGFAIAVGLDTISCESAFAAVGLTFQITYNREVYIVPWGQFWPNVPQLHPQPWEFPISPGDKVRLKLEAKSATSAFFTIINFTKQKSWSNTLTNNLNVQLCKQNAFWTVSVDQSNSPLANFGSVIFTQPTTAKVYGDPWVPYDPTIVNIVLNERRMTSVNVQDGYITVTYQVE